MNPDEVEPAGIDPVRVSDWLAGLDLFTEAPFTFTRVGDGKSNLTFLVRDAAGRRWILRRPPLGHLLASAHDVAREFRIMSGLDRTAVPTPSVRGFAEPGVAGDVPLLLMDFVDGVVLADRAALDALPVAARRTAGLSLVATLGAIHAVDLPGAGLHELASRAPYAQRQLRRWHRQWTASATRDLPLVHELHERLGRSIPPQHETVLVHGDYHLQNVILDRGASTVAAVLDWELSTLGDPVADLGGLLAYWPEPTEPPSVASPLAGTPGLPTRREAVDHYAAVTGRDVAAAGFWYALGLWKVAIIIEGVRRRTLDDERNTPGLGLPSAGMVDALLERSLAECRSPSVAG